MNWRIDDLNITATAVVPPAISTHPTAQSVVSGQSVSFTVAASGSGALSYQWRKNGAAITGNASALTATLDLGAVTTAAAGTYDVVVTDSLASTVSAGAALAVGKAAATVNVGAQTTTYNGVAQAAAATTTPSGLALAFSYTATSGTVYGPASAPPVNAGTYAVTATVNDSDFQGSGSGTLTLQKAAATVSVTSATITFDGAPHAPATATTPSGLPLNLTYNGAPAVPSAAGTYAVAATVNHANYTGSGAGTLVIAPAAATVTLGTLAATFDGTPRAATATTAPAGQTVTFTYTGINGTAYGPSTTAPTNAGTYSVSGDITGGNYAGTAAGTLVIAPGAQTITFAPLPDRLAASGPFTLAATSSSGLPVAFALVGGTPAVATLAGDTVTLTGVPGTVTVRATQPGDANRLAATPVERTFSVVTAATPPVISLPPVDTVGYVGQPASLTVFVTGAPPPTFQWRKHGVDVPGATSSSLFFPSAAASDTGLYDVVVTNAAGSVTSAPVAFSVGRRPQTITFPEPTLPYPPGTAVPLNVSASSGLPVALTLVSGAALLSNATLSSPGGIVVVRASQDGNAAFEPAAPVERTFSFLAGGGAPFFTAAPTDQTVNAGGTATLRATVTGNPAPTYQWQKDGVDLPGGTAGTLTLTSVTATDAGRYTIVATNVYGAARASAQLTVQVAPVIVTPPADQVASTGDAVTLRVVATGTPAPTYQWRRNGTAVTGATQASLTFASVATANAGRYDVVVTNALGAVTSPAATLTVNTRNLAGVFFGRFSGAGAAGDFALRVRADGTAVFLGHLPGLQTGIATTDLRVGAAGEFSLNLLTLASTSAAATAADPAAPAVAAAPRPVSLRGRIDSETGAVTGQVPELGATLEGARAPAAGTFAARAGSYQIAAVGSPTGRGYAIVGADGQSFLLTSDSVTVDSVRGTLDANGRLAASTAGGASVDLVVSSTGAVSGTARLPGGGAAIPLAGAIEGVAGTEHLVNLSVRSTTSNPAPLITGFVITGSTPKQVLIRAAGPALAGAPFNVANPIADPALQLFRGTTVAAQNDDWGTPAANAAAITAAAARAGAFPFASGSNDAALLATLPPGPYTAVVAGGNGATLAEIYEVLATGEAAGTRRLGNLSARGPVVPGAPLIAGFVVTGTAPQRLLLRGVGPSLAAAPFNLTGTLANPQLTLFRGATALRNNDDWFRDADLAPLIRAVSAGAGAFPLGAQSLDAVLLLYLEPGAYTVQVSGPTNAAGAAGAGLALVEIYEVAP